MKFIRDSGSIVLGFFSAFSLAIGISNLWQTEWAVGWPFITGAILLALLSYGWYRMDWE